MLTRPMMRALPLALVATIPILAVSHEGRAASLLEQPPREMAFRLDAPGAPAQVDWLLPFRDASVERPGPFKLYASSRWGQWTSQPWLSLRWSLSEPAIAPEPVEIARAIEPRADVYLDVEPLESVRFVDVLHRRPRGAWYLSPSFDFTGASVASDGFDTLFKLPPSKPVVDWRCRRKPVTFVRYGGESDPIDLVRCDGSMAPGALDRLSILARPPEVDRPLGELPDDPDPTAWKKRREWVPGIRVVHPRLVWALQRIADALPGRAVYVYSGYRPLAEVNDGSGHKSLHAEGRAVDISVLRVPNEKLFEVCRELKDVGCGYYPNGKFVHVSVRRAHSGRAAWIDASQPGEPARYVDAWQGVTIASGTP
jgi:hypothetical protein